MHVLARDVVSPRVIFNTFVRKSRLLVIYSLVTLALVLLTWGLFKGARHLFIQGERFQLNEVMITPSPHANSFLNHSTLPSLTGLEYGVSIFDHDLSDIRDSLEVLPEIKEISLSRRLPGSIHINIEERVPVAKLELDGKLLIVDKEGFSFQSPLSTPGLIKSLPRIIPLYGHDVTFTKDTQHLSDIGVQRAVQLIANWSEFNVVEYPLSIEVKNYHSLEMITSTQTKLTFGYYEHERQIQDFLSIKSYSLNTGQEVTAANLLPYKNIPVVFNKTRKTRALPSPPVRRVVPREPTRIQDAPQDDVLLILEQG